VIADELALHALADAGLRAADHREVSVYSACITD
jgi:hypothetical protein